MTEYFAEWDFETITNIDDVKTYAELAKMIFTQNEGKDSKTYSIVITEFLNKLMGQIRDVNASGKSKYMSLMMLKQFTEKHILAERKQDKCSKLFSLLASHPILKEIKIIALQTDPLKQVNQKGKNYFPESATVGNDFIRLALELIKYWGSKFPTSNKGQATNYKKYSDQLLEKRVIFPTEYKFLAFANSKSKNMEESDTNRYRSGAQQKQVEKRNSQSGRNSTKSQVVLMYSRLLNFIQILDEDASTVQSEIRKTHSFIKQQMKKFQGMQNQMGQLIQRDPQTFQKYISLVQFMHKQLQYYDEYISSNNTDFQSYVLAIKLEGQKIFAQLNQPTPKEKPVKSSGKPNAVSSKIKEEQAPKQSAFDPKSIESVSSYFHKLQQRSKSPIAGFTKINQTLSKQKASTIKKSVSPLNKKNKFTSSMTSLKQSKISTIFANPPNPHPPIKNYQGREINQNIPLNMIMRSISKSQGMRRFKTANFKGKSSLFENEDIQIGYKSQAIYEQISGFKVMMKIELFIGNLGDKSINDLTLEFKGDQNVLLYANPRVIQRYVEPAQQNKIDLIIVPVKIPFPLLKMTVKYNYQRFHEVIIPNSVLKLAHFMSISKGEFQNRWITSDIIKTQEFKLCHYLPPDSFKKWIPQLGQLSGYTAFAAPGSKKDYQLYCVVIMMQRYESLLKLSIRPNLEVVIQLGMQDRNEECLQYSNYFVQTLQQLLKQQSL